MHRFNDALPEHGERNDNKAQCHECQRYTLADEMAELDGKHFCNRCLDPKQPAHDYIVTMVEHMAAEIQGLKAERRRLTAELNMMRRRVA